MARLFGLIGRRVSRSLPGASSRPQAHQQNPYSNCCTKLHKNVPPANGAKPFDYSPVYECRTGLDSDYQVDWVIARAGCCKHIRKFFQYSRNPETRKDLRRSQYRRFAGCLSGVSRMVLRREPALLLWSLWLGGSMPAGLRSAPAFDQRL